MKKIYVEFFIALLYLDDPSLYQYADIASYFTQIRLLLYSLFFDVNPRAESVTMA